MNEKERIRLAYGKRHTDGIVYSLFSPGQLFMAQELEKDLIKLFRRHRINPLNEKKILDVGCGVGWRFREFERYGARKENLVGIDLRLHAIVEGEKNGSNVAVACASADTLPFGNETFDIVMHFAMFTSIIEDRMKQDAAEQMLRVLKQDGIILWYDYIVRKPTNPDVKGIGKREIIRLFPSCTCSFSRVTLAPPIARAVAPRSFLLCYLLDKIPWLRTHYLAVIKKK